MSKNLLFKKLPNWLIIGGAIFSILIFLSLLSYGIFEFLYNGKVYPGVRVAGLNLAGLSEVEATKVLEEKALMVEKGLVVEYSDTSLLISGEISSLDPDLDARLFDLNTKETAMRAYAIGREKNFSSNLAEKVDSFLRGREMIFIVSTNRIRILKELEESFSPYEEVPVNAGIVFNEDEEINITEEINGLAFAYDEIITEIVNRLENAQTDNLLLQPQVIYPEIRKDQIGDISLLVEELLAKEAVTLKHENLTWKIEKSLTKNWLEPGMVNGQIVPVYGQTKIIDFLEKEVAPKIDKEPVEAKLNIDNGKVSIWQAGRDGAMLNREVTADNLAATAFDHQEVVEATVEAVANTVTSQSAEELGLREIIGTGSSSFAGSPANRRHNIKIGADALNGILLKPGEEFSLLKALGEISGRTGYKTELVIKGNRTIPEYGGGLCQIGTTIFRSTFNTGLPVTQRRNHSYRVSYYEPAGTDATIYNPAPDYRFVNDTQNHVLIQARFEGDTLHFDLWGTKDGRKVEVTDPVIYNIVQPKPTKIIETFDLPEGQRECTERAHAGADAYFDTTVTYADGTVRQKRFTSHYVPWQAVCLVGAKRQTEEPKEEVINNEPEQPEEQNENPI